MSKNKHTDFSSYGGQANELANNMVSEMVREVNVCYQVSFFLWQNWRALKNEDSFKMCCCVACGCLKFM